MRGGYGSHRVCVCVCVYLSVPALAVTCLVYKYQLRYCRVPYGVTNVCIVWISLKVCCSRDMALFPYHEGPRRFLLTEDSPTVLDRTSNEYVKRKLQQTTIALHKIATNCSPICIYRERAQHVHLSLAHVIP